MRRIVAIVLVLLASAPALAEEAAGRAEETAGATYLRSIVEGHRLYRGGDHAAAERAYRSALEAMPDDAFATFLVATAQRAVGEVEAALDSFRRAAELAGDGDAALHAHALWNVAMIQEARREFGAAREAYRAYITYAESHARVTTYVANARQRIGAITAIEELDAAYAPVRERIAAGDPEPGAE